MDNNNSQSLPITKGINVSKVIYLFVKRIFDIIIGLIGTLFLIPLTIFIKIGYILTGDFNSIFFTQDRIGEDGKIFKLFKYRSMVPNADDILKELLKDKKIAYEYNKNKKLENDPRITKMGKIIRRYSLDEFPQFINVLIGNMSLIGNRPYLPREKKDMGDSYDIIITTKPGITGYWQVSGRSDVSFKKRLKLESYYSSNYSMLLDLKIFFKTFSAVFGKKGAK